jgi:multidrug efflux pump subunit AcrA (membrane-fusion protein)
VAPTPTPEIADDFETVIWASGEVIPATWANLSFPISGQVIELPVSEGNSITAGTVLAQLDTAELEDAVAAAEAGVAIAQADLARLKAGARPGEIAQAEDGPAKSPRPRKLYGRRRLRAPGPKRVWGVPRRNSNGC